MLRRQRLLNRFYSRAVPILLPVLLFAVLAAAPFFWTTANNTYSYIGGADYLSPINILISFPYSIYPFNHLNAAGIDQGFLLATTPLNFFYYILKRLGATPLFSTIILLSLLIFVAQLSFFACLRYFMTSKLRPQMDSTAACTLGAVLYGFSPYVIALVIPGHIMTLFVYAPLPLIIRYLDSLLTHDKLDRSAAVILFLVFALCAPGFANIGIIYVLLVACTIYFISVILLGSLPIRRSVLRFFLFVALVFLSNAWWLAPHLYNIKHYVALSETSATGMVQLVAYASAHAAIVNLFQGKPESLMYMIDIVGNNYYVNTFLSTAFLAVSLLFVFAAFKKQRQVWVLLFSALASVILVKGVQAPFSDLFFWAYENVPGFQIFRRPVAKFNGFFLFFFLGGATLGLAMMLEKYATAKWMRRALLGGAGVVACYLVFILTQTSSLMPFNVPGMYFKAANYLVKDQVERVLILPSTNGLNPVYRPAMNSYGGLDFINEVFRFPTITPDSTSNSLNEPYKIVANELMLHIREDGPICATSRVLGISHIVVRDDLARSQVEDIPRSITAVLDKHPDIAKKTTFMDGNDANLVVYKIKTECAAKLLDLDGNFTSFRYDFINPGKIVLNIEGLRGSAKLTFLDNFNNNWAIFADQDDEIFEASATKPRSSVAGVYSAPDSLKLSFDDLFYAFRRAPFENTHALSLQYANFWILDAAFLKREIGAVDRRSNSDGSINVRLVLFYQPQAFFYLGIVISLVTLAGLLFYRFKMTAPKTLGHL